MAEDVRIDLENQKFKFRVCGLLKVGDKYLVCKMDNKDYYCLPGGHVEINEDTDRAVLRETEEELGYKVKIEKLFAIIQNIFTYDNSKIKCHELGYYYIVSPVNIKQVNIKNYERIELDKGHEVKLEFKWFSLEEMQKINLKPAILKQLLKDGNSNLSIILKEKK